MKKREILTLGIKYFEPISKNLENKLIGGFSRSQSSSTDNNFDFNSNNCADSNCASSCSSTGIQNTKCNTFTNCGGRL